MNELLSNRKIDVVDFDRLKLFMFKDDNLYNNFVARERKNQSLASYFRSTVQNEYPEPTITFSNCEETDDPKAGLFIYLKHLLDRNIQFTVFDIGSHIGDFAIKCGHFFRHAGKNVKVISFDPSPAGMLVPFNIEINGLQEYNIHEKMAVTEYDGYYIFNFKERDSDSSKLSFAKGMTLSEKLKFYRDSSLNFKFYTAFRLLRSFFRPRSKCFDLIVRGINICNYLETNGIDHHLFFKVDVEGYDETLVRSIVPLKKNRWISLITELHVDFNSLLFLKELSEHFFIFDLYYCPNPTRFQHIEPNQFKSFIDSELKNRKFGYTDLFLLDKTIPDIEILMQKLTQLKEQQAAMVL